MTNVALLYLRKHSASQHGLVRVLENKVRRHLREFGGELEPAKALIAQVVERMVKTGYVNDARMAESKTASLHRQGKSSRVIELKLREKGIDPALAKKSAISTPEQEFEAACRLVKKKRLGVDPARNRRDFAVLMRAGFGSDVARQALRAVADEAASEAASRGVIQLPPSAHQLEQEEAVKFEAAVALVQRKKLGLDPQRKQRDLGVLVRAGHSFEVAKRALQATVPT